MREVGSWNSRVSGGDLPRLRILSGSPRAVGKGEFRCPVGDVRINAWKPILGRQIGEMDLETAVARPSEPVHQFSVFIPNRMGRMHAIVHLLAEREVHVVALSVLDTTDSTILRILVDDPDRARALLEEHALPFTENTVVAVEFEFGDQLQDVLVALREAELNVHYVYPFLLRPGNKPALVLSLENPEVAEQSLRRHQFRVLYQADITR